VVARLEGLEPPTYGLEIRCSIPLSYRRYCYDGVDDGDRTRDSWIHSPVLYQLSYAHHLLRRNEYIQGEPLAQVWSGREDLNLRLPAPKAGALPGCATPRKQRPEAPTTYTLIRGYRHCQ
jgi:hypothetical protein